MANFELDKYDKKIINNLLEDSSISNLNLSHNIGLAASSCLARVKNLRKQNVITGYTATIDEKKLGFDITSFVKVSMSPLSRETSDRFVQEISGMPEVVECYNITGDSTFLIKVVAKNFQEYRDFVYDKLLTIPNVSNVDSSIVVATEKKTTLLPLD